MSLRVGIVGLGVVSATHRSALQETEHVRLVASCDTEPSRRIEGTAFYTDFHEMAREEHLDAVHICLPHHLHLEATRAFAERGTHVLCEKPVAMTVAQWLEMRLFEKTYGVTIAVCQQNRWNASFVELQSLLGRAESGPMRGIKVVAAWARPYAYYQSAPWRASMRQAGGGCMINQALHALDQMLQIGGTVRSVRGQIANLSGYPIEVEDTACASIRFDNGAQGLFLGSVCNRDNASIEIEVTCDKRTYAIKDYALWSSEDGGINRQLMVRDPTALDGKTYYGASHRLLIDDFYKTLAGAGSRYVSVESAGAVLCLIEAIRRSSERNETILWEEIT
ncbi:MAG TPA: Gfo/Idh/MocA family oxidoreductase [Clostridia bacterium]|nr:Gfo/Idh/MocA family oxidoreductase [Clostridia bacterium]HPK14853.1 Gfo/Idh/MocA family oxidoreductase [Clostridia bacterium]